MIDDIRSKKLLYHLTSLRNLRSIIAQGLLPRANLDSFVDVADPEIIANRQGLNLEQKVPFHFFAKNPFDGRVQRDHPGEQFVLIAVHRSIASEMGWQIIPTHPLGGGEIQLLGYDAGMAAIEWDVMNTRDYSNQHCKCVCMAECLSPGPVSVRSFHAIYVKDEDAQRQVLEMMRGLDAAPHVNVMPSMFVQ